MCGFVSNGNATPEVLEFIRPYVSLYKVDLKGFRDAHYRELGGKLKNIVDTIERLHAMGFWLEIVTLLIPGSTTIPAELRDLDAFLVVGLAGHPVARHRVPRRLQDDRIAR